MTAAKATTTATSSPGIKKITYASGKVVYRAVVDAGPDPATGRRRQLTITRRTLRDAKAERARLQHDRDAGTLIAPRRDLTVEKACREWLAGQRDLEESSRRTYEQELKQPIAALGAVKVQALTRQHVEDMVTAMLDGTARRIGRKGQPLSAATVKMAVGRLASVLDGLVSDGVLPRNVARGIKLPKQATRPDEKGWTVEQARVFLGHVRGDRHRALYWLSLCGLRRHEVLGLRWADIDLDAGTVRVRKSKTASGVRVLPLFDPLPKVLAAHRDLLAAEASMAGGAYQPSDLLAVDELGAPIPPEWYSDEWLRQVKAVGFPRCTLHSARHTAGGLLHELTRDPWLVQAWLGHSRATFTMQHYVDTARMDAMRAAGARFGAVLDPDVRET